MTLKKTIGAATLIVMTALPAIAADKSVMEQAMEKTPDQLLTGIETQHPAIYYILSTKLFDADRKDEAVFWFYAGQLRFRFHLAAHPDLDKSGDPALFASFAQTIGTPINQWAFGDLAKLEKTIAEVKAWDEKTANGFTSKKEYAEQWKATRDGMDQLVQYIQANRDKIREQRKANGLENRS